MAKDLDNLSPQDFVALIETLRDRFNETLTQPGVPEALSLADWMEHFTVFAEFDDGDVPVDPKFWEQETDDEEEE